MMNKNVPLLQVKNLTIRLQVGHQTYPAVDHLSFDLHKGKTLALLGESGCGKSMTALALLRILSHPPALPPEGSVVYKENNLLDIEESEMRKIRGARIAMIFQDPMSALNPVYTIGYQLAEVAELHLDTYGEDAWKLAETSLTSVGIPLPKNCLNMYPHQLSGGMKQRVMIAMALMCEPDILIADEPTTALDVTIQAQVLDLMRALQQKRDMAILLITHDIGVVAEMAHDVIVMYAGQKMEYGSVRDLFNQSAHPYTMGLFQSRPIIEDERKRLTPISGTVPTIDRFPSGCRFHPRCPFVMPKCKSGNVPNFDIQDTSQTVKCWLYEKRSFN